MKRNMQISALFSIALTVIILLTSCGGSSDVPDKMQLVRGGEDVGYYFYGPEGWVVANQGDISCTYVSSIDYSSATFAPLEENALKGGETVALAVSDFFNKDAVKFQKEPFSEFKISKNGEKCSFGNSDEAYKFIYSYTYETKPYTCMQIIAVKNGAGYIFTYNASSKDYRDEKSFYQFYLTDYIQKIIDNFKFTEKKASAVEKIEYERDNDGSLLVSKKNECGFSMWAPDEWKVDYSTAIVSISLEDGSNINMSELINNAVSVRDNYLKRKEKLSELVDSVDNENGEKVSSFIEIKGIKKDENGKESLHIIELENARSAAEFEYKYTLFGKTYHVYQVFVVNGYLDMKAFVFTFTAEEDSYTEHIDEVQAILRKIGY